VVRGHLLSLLDDPSSLFVPTTEHCERILRKSRDSRSKQEHEYLVKFLQQFLPFQTLSNAGLDALVRSMAYERCKAGTARKPGAVVSRRVVALRCVTYTSTCIRDPVPCSQAPNVVLRRCCCCSGRLWSRTAGVGPIVLRSQRRGRSVRR
jgi:hypothetical protein